MRGDPNSIADKWANRLQGATAEISAGVDRVTEAPGQAAARKSQKWLQAVTASHDKYKAGVSRVSLEDWRNSMKTLGVPRIGQGAQAKKNKMAAFLTEVGPHIDAGLARLKGMDDSTFEARQARAVAWMQHMHNFKRRGGAGS